MTNLIILLLVWCTGMVLCYAWYLAVQLRRAFREEVVTGPAVARVTVPAGPENILSYAAPPRENGIIRRWPALQAILGIVVVLVPMSLPLLPLMLMGYFRVAHAPGVACAVGLGLVLLAAAIVAGRGLRDFRGRPAATSWRYLGRAALGWILVLVLTWAALEWRIQQMLDMVSARADALGQELEVVSHEGEAAAALYRQAGVLPPAQYNFDDTWELVTADGRVVSPPAFPEAHAFRIPLLRQAAAMETNGLVPPAAEYSLVVRLPHLGGLRQAAMLLRRHAIAEAQAGRVDSAIADINAMHAIANQGEQGLCLVDLLVATGIHAMAADALQHVLPMVNDPRLLDQIRLEDPASRMAALQRSIKADVGILERRSVVLMLRVQAGFYTSASPLARSGIMAAYRTTLGENDVRIIEAFAKELPEAIPDDPVAALAVAGPLGTRAMAARQQSPVAGAMIPSLMRAIDVQVEQVAMAELSRAAIAATRYRLQQGRLPGSFKELVQAGLLPAVPIDPFTSKPMGFAVHPGYVFIYTVGASRANSGGSPYMLGKALSVKPSNPGFVLSDRPLWELDLVPPGTPRTTQETEPQ